MFSIIVPIKNQYQIVKKCIDSIVRHYKDQEIILVDDCSTETELIKYLHEIDCLFNAEYKWKVLRTFGEKSAGHTASCTFGIDNSSCENLFLLNSDTILTKNSLKILSKVLDENKDIAIVGPKTSSASGPQLSLEAYDNRFKWTIDQIEKFAEECETIEDKPFDIDLVCGFCFGIKKSIFREVGGFDPTFVAYGNEKELQIRIRKNGYRTVFVPKSYTHHFGKMSYSHENINIGRAQRDADILINRKHKI